MKLCPCGSGKSSWWENDARGIPLARVCVDCKKQKLSNFRPEVLTNPQYETDEPIDEDEVSPEMQSDLNAYYDWLAEASGEQELSER